VTCIRGGQHRLDAAEGQSIKEDALAEDWRLARRWIGAAAEQSPSPRSSGVAAEDEEINKGGSRRCTWKGFDALAVGATARGRWTGVSLVAGRRAASPAQGR
jgi:hypothetical protein